MDYQTFRGSDVREALGQVREALGADALIESTRHVSNGRGGALSKTFVEIVAAPSQPPEERARPAAQKRRGVQRQRSVPAAPVAPVEASLGSGMSYVSKELSQLRLMLDELTRGRPPRDRTRALLAAAGFEGSLARELSTGATSAARAGNQSLREFLRQRVASRLKCKPGLIEGTDKKIITCVGSTGVGKTTTLAKLAARAVLQNGRRVRVVSLDTYRVGAVEQWQRYAELIGLSFDVAQNAGAFHRVVHKSSEDLILVDTAGGQAGGESSLLGSCLNGLRRVNVEVLLVLPAWLRARDAERMRTLHGSPKATGVVVTKLDEAEQVGGAMHAALEHELPISYLCNGARVPEDIHDASLDGVLDAIFPEQA